jgi:hypothetical protein
VNKHPFRTSEGQGVKPTPTASLSSDVLSDLDFGCLSASMSIFIPLSLLNTRAASSV